MSASSRILSLEITNVDYKRKDPVFWIEVRTNLIKYKFKYKRIPRYYSELQKLYSHLESTLDDVLIPALPTCPSPRFDKEGQLVGRQWWLTIKLPQEQHYHQQQQQEEEEEEEENIGLLESKIQSWLDCIANHDRTKTSEGLREFVESEVGFRPTLSKSNSKTRNKQLIITVSEQDMEPEFAYWTKQQAAFLNHLNNLVSSIEKLILEKNEMATCWMELSSSWVSYGGMERNPNLFVLYKSIAKGYQQLHDLEKSQSIAFHETLGDETVYQIKNCDTVTTAMQRRLNTFSDYVSSRKLTESSLKHVERLKSSINIDRNQASEAIAILENARMNERENLTRFKRVDNHLRNDIEYSYKPNMEKDMLRAIKEYAKSQLFLEKKKLLIFQDVYNNKTTV